MQGTPPLSHLNPPFPSILLTATGGKTSGRLLALAWASLHLATLSLPLLLHIIQSHDHKCFPEGPERDPSGQALKGTPSEGCPTSKNKPSYPRQKKKKVTPGLGDISKGLCDTFPWA